ncbi:uncharacterized protein LOC132729079 [Ruditapes philippinarum]|uniref:uncharacterized protein LOC132729079 n=1 Tax=Ruditapes philippinarum TaxID=129788 RepID=UPI00295ADE17|nr:uncharacterized protein LOC132729079 [Ruditapes philippinarum]
MAEDLSSNKESSKVDLLLGNDYYLDIVMCQRMEVKPGLYLLASKLGWILTGRIQETSVYENETNMLILTHGSNVCVSTTNVFASVDSVVQTKPELEDFWKIESLGITDSQDNTNDEIALMKFKDTLIYDNGMYQVTWPWKEETPELPENRELALARLKSNIARMKNKPEVLKKYNEVIQDQLSKGVIEKIDRSSMSDLVHYIPHHAVITPHKSTTKLRVVYDASAKSDRNNKSLNECLYRGPVMIRDLCGLLMRFRHHQVALVSDIEKAFLQIGLQQDQRDVTRFLWIKDIERPIVSSDNVQEFRFCRVPFGIISSPFLLGATLESHLETYNNNIADKIKGDIYVDNVITGTNTWEEAYDLYKTSKRIFANASMNLREWASNSSQLNEMIPTTDQTKSISIKVLGHTWDTKNDTLTLNESSVSSDESILTKRIILKQIASVFDPLGLLCPVVLEGKILLQSIWKKKYDWDDLIEDDDICEIWSTVKSDIKSISDFKIPRSVSLQKYDEDTEYRLLCFCDASTKAYATAIYLHQKSKLETKVDLVFAKSRLAPLKEITIPRLELMAVLIGVRCLKFVSNQLQLNIKEKYLWTDSKCVLHWIQSKKELPVFVKNRISEIKSDEGIKFEYVLGNQNPADIASRGCSVKTISDGKLWWHGPLWLQEPEDMWISVKSDSDICDKYENDNSEKVMTVSEKENNDLSVLSSPFEIDIAKFSSLTKLLRVTAFAVRFVRKLRKLPCCESKSLKYVELKEAEEIWLKHVQRKHFACVYDAIKNEKKNNLRIQFGLFIDEKGLLRCKGRLENADLTESAKHPVLLPKKDRLTYLVIDKMHKDLLHSGVSQTLAYTRQRFWIPHGRAVVKSVLHVCSTCRRFDGGPYKIPQMPPLPTSRVTECKPFSRVGLDYLGPLYIKSDKGQSKVWICLFTCFVTRAIHLEIVMDMSTEEFLLCLRRFISQRGTPVQILSDNASQFKAACSVIEKIWYKMLQSEEVQTYVSNSSIKWNFITELAPWMGGFYERLVG